MVSNLTMKNIVDKTIVITGASDGIGLAAAKYFKQMNMNVVIVGRNPDKTKSAAESLDVPFFVADFSKLSEVRRLSEELHKSFRSIDYLINNAGGIFGEREITIDGNELTLQVNHLAHFLLTDLLIDTLIKSRATIINTSSVANKAFAKLDISDLNMTKQYSPNQAYGNAKLANILFTKELDRRYRKAGITAAAFHPGMVTTNFASGSSSWLKYAYQNQIINKLTGLISPEKGIETLVWLVTTKPGKDWEQGEYFYKRKTSKAHKLAYSTSAAEDLWEESKRMTELAQ